MFDRCAKRRLPGVLCLALVVLACVQAFGYTKLGSDRVLLMNNDTNIHNSVSYQGYRDTDSTKETYWVHSSESAGTSPYLKAGRFHTLLRSGDDSVLWRLEYCRAGSGTSSTTARNYISWSATSESINTAGDYGFSTVAAAGTVVFCNSTNAVVYSPCLDGIGAVYFDAVNSITNVPVSFGLEVATDVLDDADEGVTLASTNYDQFAWMPCPFDVLTRTVKTVLGRKAIVVAPETNNVTSFALSSKGGGDKMSYRVRANVYSFLNGHRGPVRFKIVRKSTSGTSLDANFMAVDNIVASYPPMTAEINPFGTYDPLATGVDVIGCEGAFTPPFLSAGMTNVQTLAYCSYITNGYETIENPESVFLLSNARIAGRWRYLGNSFDNWKTNSLVVSGSNIFSSVGFDLPNKVGDWEFYYLADQKAPHYVPVDYTTATADGTAYGKDWSEELTNIVCRANYATSQASGGTDWFTRIREGASDYEYVELVGQITTNSETKAWGVDMHTVENNERRRMELVRDHVWRYHYYVPTNAAGQSIRFHFEGVRLSTNDTPFVYQPQKDTWYANRTKVRQLPDMVAATGDTDIELDLDNASTHLLFEFNDDLKSFSISRATYQNFNLWSDATEGYRGDYTSTTGVSDVKRKFDAAIAEWEPTSYARPALWREAFDTDSSDPRYPLDTFRSSWQTPNGWSAENGLFTLRRRGTSGIAFQMQGQGLGSLSLNNLSSSAIPRGIGTVRFTARVAQTPDFSAFNYYFLGGNEANYAISAKVTMSRLYVDNTYNPPDISPTTPSVSLVGYLRGQRDGCYEFRVTRTGDRELTAAIYRWKNLASTCLASNIIVSSGSSGVSAEQKNTYGVGRTFNTETGSVPNLNPTFWNADNNLIVPKNASGINNWTVMCFSLYTSESGVRLDGYLSCRRNTSDLAGDVSNVKRVVAYEDKSDNRIQKGTYGIGSVGCQAAFARMYKHQFNNSSNWALGINTAGEGLSSGLDDWDYMEDRWRRLANGEAGTYGASGFIAQIPTNQTVKLMFAEQGGGWFDSGMAQPVDSFATNTFTFAPCVSPSYLVRLQSGGTTEDVRTDVVLDDVEVLAWRGVDMDDLSSKNGRPEEWVYTMGSIETTVEIAGSPYQLNPAGTNGYVYVFTNAGSTVTFKPTIDTVIDRVLLVSGSGVVSDQNWTSSPVTQKTNTTIKIVVGSSNNVSSVTGITGKGTITASSGAPAARTSDITGESVTYGGKRGEARVLIRARNASKICVLQPTRNYPLNDTLHPGANYPMGVRSPYMDNGLSVFSFSYVNANTNAELWLQICTNILEAGESYTPTMRGAADTEYWTTITNWSFKGMSETELAGGTMAYFMSLRAPQKGMMRLVVATNVLTEALSQTEEPRDLATGMITITKVFCYDEPALDTRSWWGWNLHTRGWDADTSTPGTWAYLTDWPNGRSCSLNFSALAKDNKTSDLATYGIGLTHPDREEEYQKNNPFVQGPVLANGIGSVSFRARTFETNATNPSVVILYGTAEPEAYQADDYGWQSWKRLAEFVISNNTYQTYMWKTNLLNSPYMAVRLEVGAARHGRNKPAATGVVKDWEVPTVTNSVPYWPIQRVFLDEVSIAEPVAPTIKFFDVRPFRSNLNGEKSVAITNINDKEEQPLLGESWGIQARVEPQQMADELDLSSMRVFMAAYKGKTPWGYANWGSDPACIKAELLCVDTSNLVFRSTYDNPASVLTPVDPTSPSEPYAIVQYHVWAEYTSKASSVTNRYDLDSSDWVQPSWYWPLDYNHTYGLDNKANFSAYTILDSISPGRAWINEVAYNDLVKPNRQFIELMVPEGKDLSKWKVRLTSSTLARRDIVSLGVSSDALLGDTHSKTGVRPYPAYSNYDSMNQFTVVALGTPVAKDSSVFANGELDGYWQSFTDSTLDFTQGKLDKWKPYGIELVRPSGVVEHQIVVQGTNALAGTIFEASGTGTNALARIKAQDGDASGWFYAGEELGQEERALGVWQGHGEEFWQENSTWTNDLTATPASFNLRGGTRQTVDKWLLDPNGTNIWIYARVLGQHVWQYVDGNPASSNRNAVMVVPINSSTNIRYIVDAWYQLADCTVNVTNEVTPIAVPGKARTFEIKLDNVQETQNVSVNEDADVRLSEKWGLKADNPYRPAILQWLLDKWPDKDPNDIHLAEFWPLSAKGRPPESELKHLNLTEMYWLDITPVESNWVFQAGMGGWGEGPGGSPAVEPVVVTEHGVEYTNVIVTVTMMITNATTDTSSPLYGKHHPPYTIQGLRPRSSSADEFAGMSDNWTSATFKVTGALQIPGESTNFRPLKWFVFDEDSFDANGKARIEIPDQAKSTTPGFHYGWNNFYGTPVFYRWALDEQSSGLYSTELLKSNSVHTVISP